MSVTFTNKAAREMRESPKGLTSLKLYIPRLLV